MQTASEAINPGAPGQGRRKRRWWVYLLWFFGTILGLLVLLAISAAIYWNSLVKKYTSLQPRALPEVETPAAKYDELKERWDTYFLQFLHPERAIPSFEMTGEELNLLAGRFGPYRKHAFVEVQENQIRLQFSVPLDSTRRPSLRGRFLNGSAILTNRLSHGKIDMRVASVEANGKPLPKWILRRVQGVNWLQALNQRPEFDLAIRALDRMELHPDQVILTPRPPAPAR